MLLATGGRGTRPASKTWSVLGGMFTGAACGALAGVAMHAADGIDTPDLRVARVEAPVPPAVVTPVVALPPAAETVAAASAPAAEATPTPVTSTPVVPVETPAPTPVVTPTPVTAAPVTTTPAPTPVATTTPTPTPVATSAPAPEPTRRSTSSSSSSSSSRSSSSRSTSAVAEEEAPARITPSRSSSSSSSSSSTTKATSSPPPETPKAATGASISLTVVDTMIRSNKGVKGCFINEKAESGDLPRGVKVKLTIQSSGKVSSAAIPGGDWAGTPFDDCLSNAVRGISFPPFDGEAVTMTYPFNI